MSNSIGFSGRPVIVLSIMMMIALLHILGPGCYTEGAIYNFYYSFLSDLTLPFGIYFLMCMAERDLPILRRWETKSAVVFLIASIAETCQYFGIPVLGETFDPLDYFMYGIGAISAVAVDKQVFARVFDFWAAESAESQTVTDRRDPL